MSTFLGILTVVGQIFLIFGLLVLFHKDSWKKFSHFMSKKALLFAFITALMATLGSLFYSEIAGFHPCELCWFQRIFVYPQTILLGIALWKKDRNIAMYSLVLAILGIGIAGYQYGLQMGVLPEAPCSAVGQSHSCGQQFIREFGYITIPMMSLTASAMIAFFMGILKYKKK
jgi:disulfide bond formation protein DsbB